MLFCSMRYKDVFVFTDTSTGRQFEMLHDDVLKYMTEGKLSPMNVRLTKNRQLRLVSSRSLVREFAEHLQPALEQQWSALAEPICDMLRNDDTWDRCLIDLLQRGLTVEQFCQRVTETVLSYWQVECIMSGGNESDAEARDNWYDRWVDAMNVQRFISAVLRYGG